MSRAVQFASFLDRFEEQLELNSERVKREFFLKVDQRTALVREKVRTLRSAVLARTVRSEEDNEIVSGIIQPQIEIVSLQKVHRTGQSQDDAILPDMDDVNRSQPMTARKRKPQQGENSVGSVNKRQHTQASTGSNRFVCKSPGCGKAFQRDLLLRNHERIHLGIKPYRCTWANCGFAAEQRSNVIQHIRTKHFHWPITQYEQRRLNIADTRDPNEYLQEDAELAQRRLE